MDSTTIVETSKTNCYQCKALIGKAQTIYKAGDTNQCSYDCMRKRYNYILDIDPDLKSPTMWRSNNELDEYGDHKDKSNKDNILVNKLKKTKSSIYINIDDIKNANNLQDMNIILENKNKRKRGNDKCCCSKLTGIINNIFITYAMLVCIILFYRIL
jgi:hypothetical protein